MSTNRPQESDEAQILGFIKHLPDAHVFGVGDGCVFTEELQCRSYFVLVARVEQVPVRAVLVVVLDQVVLTGHGDHAIHQAADEFLICISHIMNVARRRAYVKPCPARGGLRDLLGLHNQGYKWKCQRPQKA